MKKDFYKSDYSDSEYAVIEKTIYHYTSAEGLIGIIKNQELWFTNIYFLNDNNEIFYTYRLIEDIIKELKDELVPKFHKKIKERCQYILGQDYFSSEKSVWYRPEYYVASFSLDNDNINLWNYYTKSNTTGYNIAFRSYHFMDRSLAQGLVCYEIDKQRNMIRATILKANEEYKNNSRNKEIVDKLYDNFIIYSLFFKDYHYKNEKEYRIIISVRNQSDEEKECCYKDNNGLITPYKKVDLKELGYEKYQENLIAGVKISPVNKGEITKYGVERLLSCSDIHFGEVTFSKINMKF